MNTEHRPGFSSYNVVLTHDEVVTTGVMFDYTMTGSLGSDLQMIDVEVNPLNVAPLAMDEAFVGSLGGFITGNVLANDSDANLDALTAAVVGSGPIHSSTFELSPDGTFVYTHNGTSNFSDSFQYAASDGALTSNTATVSITIVAATINVSVSKSGPAGSEDSLVTSDPAGIDCGVGCSADSAVFMTTEAVRLDVLAATGFVFAGWSGDTDCVDGSILPVVDRTCVANFAVDTTTPPTGDPVLITVLKDGSGSGTVTSDPTGIDCGALCSATISGTPRISLSATADAGSVFVGFSGGPGGDDCEDSELDAVLDTTCSATFNLAQRTLTIDFLGGNGNVDSEPGGISCSGNPCSVIFANGSTVTLSGRPDSGSPDDVTFGGDCVLDPEFGTLATVVMAADVTCTVLFD